MVEHRCDRLYSFRSQFFTLIYTNWTIKLDVVAGLLRMILILQGGSQDTAHATTTTVGTKYPTYGRCYRSVKLEFAKSLKT